MEQHTLPRLSDLHCSLNREVLDIELHDLSSLQGLECSLNMELLDSGVNRLPSLRSMDYINSLSNKPIPWITYIQEGRKKYEGRLNRRRWKNMKVGDVLTWTDGEYTVNTRITEIRTYTDFGLAFEDLGRELIPFEGVVTADEARALYRTFGYTDEEVKEHGAIAIGLEVIGLKVLE